MREVFLEDLGYITNIFSITKYYGTRKKKYVFGHAILFFVYYSTIIIEQIISLTINIVLCHFNVKIEQGSTIHFCFDYIYVIVQELLIV